jgi:hypothetical protein
MSGSVALDAAEVGNATPKYKRKSRDQAIIADPSIDLAISQK